MEDDNGRLSQYCNFQLNSLTLILNEGVALRPFEFDFCLLPVSQPFLALHFLPSQCTWFCKVIQRSHWLRGQWSSQEVVTSAPEYSLTIMNNCPPLGQTVDPVKFWLFLESKVMASLGQ